MSTFGSIPQPLSYDARSSGYRRHTIAWTVVSATSTVKMVRRDDRDVDVPSGMVWMARGTLSR